MFSYDKIKNVLSHNKAKVTFIKADGTEREMICTLDMNQIPSDNHPKSSNQDVTKANRDVIKVFDLEINQWRSFRVDSVKSISVRKSYWTNRTENMKVA